MPMFAHSKLSEKVKVFFGVKVILETFPKPISWLGMEKLNLTQQKHGFTNQKKCTITQTQTKLKPDLVTSYDIWPRNGEGAS